MSTSRWCEKKQWLVERIAEIVRGREDKYVYHRLEPPSATTCSSSTIILHGCSPKPGRCQLLYIDGLGDAGKKMKPRIRKICSPESLWDSVRKTSLVSFSYHGLLFFGAFFLPPTHPSPEKTPPYLTIHLLNPVTQQQIVFHNYNHSTDTIVGAYFDSKAQEYRVLWMVEDWRDEVGFKLLCLGSKQTYWRKLGEVIFNECPRRCGAPVNVNGALHWLSRPNLVGEKPVICSEFISVFSIEKEEFEVRPHPGDLSKCSSSWLTLTPMHLFDLQGQVSLCEILQVANIWVLTDYSGWVWTKTYKVELDYLGINPMELWVDCLGMQGGALVFNYKSNMELISYNLGDRRVNKFKYKKLRSGSDYYSACLHTHTQVSLTNFPKGIIVN